MRTKSPESKRNASTKAHEPGAGRKQRRKRGERAFTQEEIEFLEAMERYTRENHRPLPTWSEVLEVVRSLGYRKAKATKGAEANGERWQQVVAELKEERDRLNRELVELRDDYAQVRKAVGILMQDNAEIDEEALLAQLGKGQSLEALLAELEAQYGTKGAS